MLFSVVSCGQDDDADSPIDTSTNTDNGNNNNGNNNSGDNNSGDNNTNKPSNDFSAWDTDGKHIYVSPNGLDTNDGLTEDKSVKTIERAQEIAENFVGNEEKLPVIISLDEGVYTLNSTLDVITGTADTPVIFTSRNGKAVISGGTKILPEFIKKCDDEWILNHIGSDDVKEKLYEVDLHEYNSVLTSIVNNLSKQNGTYEVVEFFSGDQTLDLARWPNYDEIGAASASFNFPSVGYEMTKYINFNDGKGGFYTPTQAASEGVSSSAQMNVFILDATYDVIKDWDFAGQDIHTLDFFGNDWDDMIHEIISFTDVSDSPAYYNNTSFKAYMTTDRGRNYNSEMASASAFGDAAQRRFAFINALEAIDLDKEYYYDYEGKKLYVYFEDEASIDDFYIATNKDGLINIINAEHIMFRNVDLRYTQQTLVNVNNSNNISFIDCSISNAAIKAAVVTSSTDITFKNCRIFDLGCGALSFQQCNEPTATTLIPANLLVENCDIGFISHRDICYAWAIQVGRCTGFTARNNTIHDGEHGACNMNLSSIVTYEYNELYNFITKTDDAGLWYDHETPETQVGNVMRYNWVHDIGGRWQTWGYNIWYTDNTSTGYSIHGNLITDIKGTNSANVTIFNKLKLADAVGNLVANVDDRVFLTNDYKGDQIFWDWRNMHSLETTKGSSIFSKLANYGVYSGAWDDTLAATDETRNYSYNMMKLVLSEEFYYSIYGTGITMMLGLHEYQDADYYVQINEETVADFGVKVKKAGHKDYNKVKTFDTVTELFDYLYTEMGYNAKTTIPETFELHYYGGELSDDLTVGKIYPPMYTYDEAAAEWKFSKGAELLGLNKSNFWEQSGDTVSEMMGRMQFRSEHFCNIGTYNNNITLNMANDFTEIDRSTKYHNGISKYDNFDMDLDVEMFDGRGYNLDFTDIVDSVKAMGNAPEFELLDLSKVGCNLKAE